MRKANLEEFDVIAVQSFIRYEEVVGSRKLVSVGG